MALRFGRGQGEAQALGKAKAEAIEQLGIGLVGSDDKANAKLPTGIIGRWENDVGAFLTQVRYKTGIPECASEC